MKVMPANLWCGRKKDKKICARQAQALTDTRYEYAELLWRHGKRSLYAHEESDFRDTARRIGYHAGRVLRLRMEAYDALMESRCQNPRS